MVELGSRKVTLISQEEEIFKVSAEIANMSRLIKDIVEDNDDENLEIPLPLISSKYLKEIV